MAHKHSVYDSDTHFSANAVTRALKNESSGKTVLVQGDHGSERFTFEIPRTIEGHDMSLCNKVEVHFNNIDAKTKAENKGLYEVDDLGISPDGEDVVICSWLIKRDATKFAGSLAFLLVFKCEDEEGIIEYAWHTLPYTGFYVSAGINADETFEDDYCDVIERWKDSVINDLETELRLAVDEMKDEVAAWEEAATVNVRAEMTSFGAQWNNTLNVERVRIDELAALRSTRGVSEYDIDGYFVRGTIKTNGVAAELKVIINGTHDMPGSGIDFYSDYCIPAEFMPMGVVNLTDLNDDGLLLAWINPEDVTGDGWGRISLTLTEEGGEIPAEAPFGARYDLANIIIPELTDARVDYNGTAYPTAGRAVREQVFGLHNRVGLLDDKANAAQDSANAAQDSANAAQDSANAAGNAATMANERITNVIVPRLETLEQGGLQIKDEYITEQINNWLDDHPEATTTVQDKSLTEDKFSDELRLTVINNYVTPQMYGAVGDGVTDDTAAFQAAVQHGKVYVPAGTYKITSLTLDKTCHISGESKKTTTIKTDGITVAASSCLLEHLTLTANTSWTGSGIKFLAGGATCRDMQVFNFDVCVDLRALENHIVTTCLTNVTVTGRFAGFAIGDPESTKQTNGVYLKRCYAVGCGGVGTNNDGASTDGYGYGYYVFGGYSVSIEDCIAEYCSGGGMYINASAQRPLNGLTVANAYFENNKIAQIYVASSAQLANIDIGKGIFVSDSGVSARGDYKREIYIENPSQFMNRNAWNRTSGYSSYGNGVVAGFSFGNLHEEAKRRNGSIMPVVLDYIAMFSDKVGGANTATIFKDVDGDWAMSSTRAHPSFNSIFSFEAKANQVYEISFKYRRVNNDDTVVRPIMTINNGKKTVSVLVKNIAYSDGYTQVKEYISFPEDMVASFGYYFDGTTGDTAEVHYKDFCVKPVSFARTYVALLQGYPQDGFILYDRDLSKYRIYDAPTSTWVDL